LLTTEITHQYGIKMSEQQLYDYIFCRKIDEQDDDVSHKKSDQIECFECLKMTNKLLEDEISIKTRELN